MVEGVPMQNIIDYLKEFKDGITTMWEKLDSHYDILDNRYFAIESVLSQLKKDITCLEDKVSVIGMRVTTGEVKGEALKEDVTEVKVVAKTSTQHLWEGLRESKIFTATEISKLQLAVEATVDLKISNSIGLLKNFVYGLIILVGLSAVGIFVTFISRLIK